MIYRVLLQRHMLLKAFSRVYNFSVSKARVAEYSQLMYVSMTIIY